MGDGITALTKRNADLALMPPPPLVKRQRRPPKVLDEDVYSEALSQIIARDFFPGLLETGAQEEYMDALDSGDKIWIRDAGRKLTQAMTPLPEAWRQPGRGTRFSTRASTIMSTTPRTFVGDTPQRGTPKPSDAKLLDLPDVDLDMSLSTFQARYTSEDNESFNTLLDKQNEKRSDKYTFFYNGNKIPSARQLLHRDRVRKLVEGAPASSALVTTNADGDSRRAVGGMRPSENLDARPASVDSFPDRHGPRNHFMFQPEGVEDRLVTRAQQAEFASNAPPKEVKYAATRFPVMAVDSDNLTAPSPSLSAVDAAIAGRPRATGSEAGYSGAETPHVNGYAFVDAEPTPSEMGIPVTDEEADGVERELTMKLLPQASEGGPNLFSLATQSKREVLHMKLVEKQDIGRRKGGATEKLQSLGVTPARTPMSKYVANPKLRKGTAMTPAAQRLAKQISTPRAGRDVFEFQGAKSIQSPAVRSKR